jgi:hypothetical protein
MQVLALLLVPGPVCLLVLRAAVHNKIAASALLQVGALIAVHHLAPLGDPDQPVFPLVLLELRLTNSRILKMHKGNAPIETDGTWDRFLRSTHQHRSK